MKERGRLYILHWRMAHKSQSMLPRPHLASEMLEVLSTTQKEDQHLILCPTSSSIFFCVHLIQPRLDKAKWFLGGFSKHLKWLCCNKQEQGRFLIGWNWVGIWMPWQVTGSHVAVLERAKSAQTVSGNCMEEEDEPCAFLSTTLSESSPYSKLSSSKVNPYLVKPSAFRNMMHTPGMPPSRKDIGRLLKWLYHQN